MSWLDPFREDIIALARAQQDLFGIGEGEDIESVMSEAREVLAPLLDGSIDPADVTAMRAAWWQTFGAREVAAAKHKITIERRLAPLYDRLASASPGEWEAYARFLIDARFDFDSPLFRFILAGRSRGETPTGTG